MNEQHKTETRQWHTPGATLEASLLEVMRQGVVLFQLVRAPDGRAVDLLYLGTNRALQAQTGLSPEAVVGRRVSEVLPSSDVEFWVPLHARLIETGSSLKLERFVEGLQRWYDVYAVPQPGDCVAVIFDDISQRKHAEEVLRADASRQAFLVRLGDTLRPLHCPIEIQGAAARVLAEHLGATHAYYLQIDEDARTATIQAECLHGAVPRLIVTHRMENYPVFSQMVRAGGLFVTNDVATTPVLPVRERAGLKALLIRALVAVALIKENRLVACLAVSQTSPRQWTSLEISLVQETAERTWAAVERAKAQAELRRTNQELETRVRERTEQLVASNASLKALFRQLVSAQEEERQRMARELHDQLGQQITALRMDLEGLRAAVGASPALEARVAHTQMLAEELDGSVDFMTRELRPTALEHLGLSGALRELVASWSRRFSIVAEFEALGAEDLRLERDTEANLYRVAQEALHNVLKHAGASHVTVLLKAQESSTVLIVEDDGRGFDPAQPGAAGGGLGLLGMRERATLAGGTLEIESAPGQGTSIYVRLPAVCSGGEPAA